MRPTSIKHLEVDLIYTDYRSNIGSLNLLKTTILPKQDKPLVEGGD